MNWMSAIGLDSLLARIRTNLNEGAIAAEDRIELARLEWSAQKKRMQTIFVLGIVMGNTAGAGGGAAQVQQAV